MKKAISIILCLVMSMIFICSAAYAQEETIEKPKTEIKIGSIDEAAVGHFDTTMRSSMGYNSYSMDLVFDYILFVDPETDEFTSNVLSDFYWDDELCGVVFTVKDGVYFSDGDQMTAEDILYTVWCVSSSFMNTEMASTLKLSDAEISEDGMTVKIPFTQPFGPWREYFIENTAIHNMSFEEANGGSAMNFDDISLVCGSGPYKVVEYVIDSYTVYEKRDDWWMEGQQREGTASVDRITVIKYSDATTMMVDYETGAIDVAMGISSLDYDRITADPALGKAGIINPNFVSMLNLNSDYSAFADKNLREVVAYGVNWEQVNQLAYGSLGTAADCTLPTNSASYIPGLSYEYDPERAQAIVDENGLAGTTLTWVAAAGVGEVIGETIQAMLSQYGINVDLQVKDMMTAIMIWMNPASSAFSMDIIANSNLGNDPYKEYRNIFKDSLGGNAKSDEHLNELLNAGRFTVNEEERVEIYKQVAQYLYDEIYCIPVSQWTSAYCYNDQKLAYFNPYDLTLPSLRNMIATEQ